MKRASHAGQCVLILLGLVTTLVHCGSGDRKPDPSPEPGPACENALAELLPDGSCLLPGIPVDGCSEGFAHDGAYGCDPILPAAPCPEGTMAIPGEATCRPVMECGEGTWGDLPVDVTTQHVDQDYGGGGSDGTAAAPWTTVTEAVAAAEPGALVAIAAGTYPEHVLVAKPVRLWGRCPEMVQIVAPSTNSSPCPPASVCVIDGASGSAIGGVTLTGPGIGIFITGSSDVLVDRGWMFDNDLAGVVAQDSAGPTSVRLTDSLVEGNGGSGVFTVHASLAMDRSVIRGTSGETVGNGRGVVAQGCAGTPCMPDPAVQTWIGASVISDNEDIGLLVEASRATVESTVVTGTRPRPADLMRGRGVSLQGSCAPGAEGLECAARSAVTMRGVVISHNHEHGIFAAGSDLVVERSTIRDTQPRVLDGSFGRGIDLSIPCDPDNPETCELTEGVSAVLSSSVVSDNHDLGIFATASQLTLEGSVVIRTKPRATDMRRGRGINLQEPCIPTAEGLVCYPTARSSGSIVDSLVADNHEVGITASATTLDVTRAIVRNTMAVEHERPHGDGFMAVDASIVVMTNSRIAHSARVGVGSYGSDLTLASVRIACAEVPLTGEDTVAGPVVLHDGGNNLCGCPEADTACKLVSAGLEPPDSAAAGP